MRIILFIYLLTPFFTYSQGTWTWVAGSDTNADYFGTPGVPNPANTPGETYAGTHWEAPNNDFYLFSGLYFGVTVSTSSDQLWKFDGAIEEWLLISGNLFSTVSYGTRGVPSPTNTPGSVPLGAAHWIDANGDFWLYGGEYTGDNMWRYNIATNMWTWMFGSGASAAATSYGSQGIPSPTNSPGRYTGESTIDWVDSNGNFWMYREDDGILWKFDPAILQWSWESGTPGAVVNYGTIGVPSATNNPGVLNPSFTTGYIYRSWVNGRGGMYMAFERNIPYNYRHELWKYDLNTSMWTCLYMLPYDYSGATTQVQYVPGCVPDTGNKPILLNEQRARWVDDCGNAWLLLRGAPGSGPIISDLWKFDVETDLFVHVANYIGEVKGTKGVPSANNHPSRNTGGHNTWTTENGFWVTMGNASYNSMLWRYNPDTVIADFSVQALCDSAKITNNSFTGCNKIKSLFWDFGDGTTSTDFDPVHAYTTPGTYQVTLIIQNCTWDADTLTKSVTITDCSLSPSITGDTICQGDCGTLMASVTGGIPPYTYSWSNGITNTNGGPVTVCPTATTTYQVVITDSVGTTDSIATQVVVIPPFSVNLGADTTVCAGSHLLQAQPSGANYLWQDGSTNQQLTITQPGLYWVEVTGDYCTVRDSINIQMYQPTASFTSLDTAGCPPITAQFFDQSSTPVGNISQWQWNFGDGSTSSGQNPTHTYAQSGRYDVTLRIVDGNGCADAFVMTQLVEVYPSPVASFSVAPVINGEEAEFLDLSVQANQWLWDLGDGTTSTDRHPTHTYPGEGTYQVTLWVTSQSGCRDSISYSLTIDIPFRIYIPNAFSPNADSQNDLFQIMGSGIGDFHLEIYDRWGKLLFESEDIGNSWDGTFGGDAVPEGVYIWKIKASSIDNSQDFLRGGSVTLLR